MSILLTSKKKSTKFYNINAEQANTDFLSNKIELETSLDAKKKIEINSQYKKIKARLMRFFQNSLN